MEKRSEKKIIGKKRGQERKVELVTRTVAAILTYFIIRSTKGVTRPPRNPVSLKGRKDELLKTVSKK